MAHPPLTGLVTASGDSGKGLRMAQRKRIRGESRLRELSFRVAVPTNHHHHGNWGELQYQSAEPFRAGESLVTQGYPCSKVLPREALDR